MAIIEIPGRNDPKWHGTYVCLGDEYGQRGCGATLRITRADLFGRHKHDIMGPRDEAILTCPCCGAETVIDGTFADLPGEKTWRTLHSNPQQEAEEQTRQANDGVTHGC